MTGAPLSPNVATALTDGRLRKRPSATLIEHVNRVELDDELQGLDAYVCMDIAHALMLTETGALSSDDGRAIVEALVELLDGDTRGLLRPDAEVGTLGLQIERYLHERVGEPGLNIQRARSRIDQKATGWRLINREHLLDVGDSVFRLGEALLFAARRFDGVLIPGYTHLQHSQPTTFDHYLNAHYWSISRNIDRLLQSIGRLNVSPLGGAAYSGTSWPIDRDRTADYLGFSGPIPNARDAGMASIDLGPEISTVLALILASASRLAADLNYWASSEVDLVEIDAALCGTSSMMPQKRNPMALERIRGLAGSAVGWPASQLGTLHTATSTDVDQAYVHNAIPAQSSETAGAIDLLREVIETISIDGSKMRASSARHWSTASALADALSAETGLSFRSAHETVARFVAAHERAGAAAGEVRMELAEHPLSLLSSERIAQILDPEHFVSTRTSAGGTSQASRQALADAAAEDLEHQRSKLTRLQTATSSARELLLAKARSQIAHS